MKRLAMIVFLVLVATVVMGAQFVGSCSGNGSLPNPC